MLGDVHPLGDQPTVHLARQQRHAMGPGMVAEPMAGQANPGATGGQQYLKIKMGPFFDPIDR